MDNTTERSTALGHSDIFPILPMLSFVAFVCCMLILPAFIKTRVVALTTLTSWLALGNLVICINMCVWRNNTRNIPIYSDFVALLWCMYPIVTYLNLFCFHKFLWNMTRPRSSLRIYDNRINHNRLDIFLTAILPILWIPFMLLTLQGRYDIFEDIGPFFVSDVSLANVLARQVPLLVITVASVWYLVLTIINVWRARSREPPKRVAELDQIRFDYILPKKKVDKYMIFSTISLTGTLFGCIWTIVPTLRDLRSERPWYTKSDIRNNIRQLPLIIITPRNKVNPSYMLRRNVFFSSIPVMAIILFAFFGLGPKALKTYHSWLQTLFSLLKLPTLFNFLRTYPLRLVSWFTQRVKSVDQEYFIPFESNDITLDPHSLVDLPRTSRRSPTQPPAQPRIKPSLHPAPLASFQKSVPTIIFPLEERRTYHKQAVPTKPRSIHHSPQSRPSTKDRQVFVASDGCIAHHKETVSSRFAPQTSIPLSFDRPRFSDGLPPPYRRPVDRGSISDPLFALF